MLYDNADAASPASLGVKRRMAGGTHIAIAPAMAFADSALHASLYVSKKALFGLASAP